MLTVAYRECYLERHDAFWYHSGVPRKTVIVGRAVSLSTDASHSPNRSAWRHWGCVTKKVLSNVKEQFEKASEVDGYEDMKPEDQAKVDKAWEDGQVADEDIPETARKAEGEPEEEEEEEKPKKARGKKKADDGEEKPKKPRAPRAKVCGADAVFAILWLNFSVEGAQGR